MFSSCRLITIGKVLIILLSLKYLRVRWDVCKCFFFCLKDYLIDCQDIVANLMCCAISWFNSHRVRHIKFTLLALHYIPLSNGRKCHQFFGKFIYEAKWIKRSFEVKYYLLILSFYFWKLKYYHFKIFVIIFTFLTL
jgi:hypothetical protein